MQLTEKGPDLDLTHEVRTHLAIIALASANLDRLYERLDEAQRRRMIRSICESSQALNDLVHGGYLGC
jgi:K+-sensing histidine kinase KdpD